MTDPTDRAARYAHELAEIDRVIRQHTGDPDPEHIGAPLHEVIADLLAERGQQ